MGKLVKMSLKERVVSDMRARILSGALPPRSRVTKRDLSEGYGVVRETRNGRAVMRGRQVGSDSGPRPRSFTVVGHLDKCSTCTIGDRRPVSGGVGPVRGATTHSQRRRADDRSLTGRRINGVIVDNRHPTMKADVGKLVKMSLKDRVVSDMRARILSGALPPRSRVTEQDIRDTYGVSRSVVREAMLVLELQGLLTSTAYIGSEVASISKAEVEGLLLPLRVLTEQFAFRHGHANLDTAHFDRFDEVLRQMERAVNDQDVAAFNESDFAFHALIIDLADSESARGVWDLMHSRITMHFALQTGRTGALVQFLQDHRDLVDVFRTGDVEVGATALAAHIYDTNRPFLNLLDQDETA